MIHKCLAYYVFFFFKQKTAYDMRISDWSSDVCSSDLAGSRYCQLSSNHPTVKDCAAKMRSSAARPMAPQKIWRSPMPSIKAPLPYRQPSAAGRGNRAYNGGWQMGRAGCRVRVWQYVSIASVAGHLKNKESKKIQ